MNQPFRLRQRLHSFRYACAGLGTLLRTQHNAWLHAAATVLVIALGAYLHLVVADWLWLLLALVLVWMAEAFNTALELLADAVTRDHHPLIGQAKDVAAAAVLIAALGALMIGVLVLGPPLSQRLL
jgi:diacylglycerol kinase